MAQTHKGDRTANRAGYNLTATGVAIGWTRWAMSRGPEGSGGSNQMRKNVLKYGNSAYRLTTQYRLERNHKAINNGRTTLKKNQARMGYGIERIWCVQGLTLSPYLPV